MNYYKRYEYVSNSDLSSVERALAMTPPLEGDFLAFGSLVDAMITEQHLLNPIERQLLDSANAIQEFSEQDWNKALKMAFHARCHPLLSQLISVMKFQETRFVDEFLIDSPYAMFHLPARCKYDGVNYDIRTGLDLKTTGCTTKASFLKSIEMFNYDRQSAWYMDLGGLDKFILAGISKMPNRKGQHEIFLHAIQRDDAMYLSGRAKYQYLAYMYDLLIMR